MERYKSLFETEIDYKDLEKDWEKTKKDTAKEKEKERKRKEKEKEKGRRTAVDYKQKKSKPISTKTPWD